MANTTNNPGTYPVTTVTPSVCQSCGVASTFTASDICSNCGNLYGSNWGGTVTVSGGSWANPHWGMSTIGPMIFTTDNSFPEHDRHDKRYFRVNEEFGAQQGMMRKYLEYRFKHREEFVDA